MGRTQEIPLTFWIFPEEPDLRYKTPCCNSTTFSSAQRWYSVRFSEGTDRYLGKHFKTMEGYSDNIQKVKRYFLVCSPKRNFCYIWITWRNGSTNLLRRRVDMSNQWHLSDKPLTNGKNWCSHPWREKDPNNKYKHDRCNKT